LEVPGEDRYHIKTIAAGVKPSLHI